jgi:hypothetical protein
MAACGDDDGGASPTTTEAAGESASASATEVPSPSPTTTSELIDEDGEIFSGHPLIIAIAARYLSLLPPVAFTDPISCEGINEDFDEADEEERATIDELNVGRICILLSQSTFEEEEATVVVGFYRSDVIDTLDLELQAGGGWAIVSVVTPEPEPTS